MKYVLDSCVAFKWLVPEANTPKAIRLLDDFENGIHDLIAPDILLVEAVHALTRAERQGRITPAEGASLLKDLMQHLPPLFQYVPLVGRAYDISSKMRVGVYDCIYVALAERESCELVTADDRLIKNLQAAFPFIVALASVP